jgi:type IV secretory pathway TrbF-like protein
MKKQIFHDAATGVLIGLILSILFSLIYAPNTYAPLSPDSLVGQVMVQHQVHGSLVLLYCMVIWSAIVKDLFFHSSNFSLMVFR